MAYIADTQRTTVWASIKSFFSMVGTALTVSSAMDAGLKRIDALRAKSDAELDALGLRRDGIPAYVFRDLMYL